MQNMPSALLWEALPAHLMANILHLIGYTMRGHGKVVLKAKMDAFRFTRALSIRRKIQKTRPVSRVELLRTMERGPLQPYLLGYYNRMIGRTIQSPGESQ